MARVEVESRLWFVQQQNLRLVQDGAGDGSALLHSVGKGSDAVSGPAGEANSFQHGGYPGITIIDAIQAGIVNEVFPWREVVVEEAAVTHDADSAPKPRRSGGGVRARRSRPSPSRGARLWTGCEAKWSCPRRWPRTGKVFVPTTPTGRGPRAPATHCSFFPGVRRRWRGQTGHCSR